MVVRWWPVGSPIHAFDWYQNQRPWMTLKGHYALCFKTRAPWCLLFTYFLFHIRSAFSRQMTAGARTALTFRKLKQITIKESLDVWRTRCITRFACDSTALVSIVICFTVRPVYLILLHFMRIQQNCNLSILIFIACWLPAVGWEWLAEASDSKTAERKPSVKKREKRCIEQESTSHYTEVFCLNVYYVLCMYLQYSANILLFLSGCLFASIFWSY